LKMMVTKHIQDPSLAEIVTTPDMAPTSTERGISHYEHSHLVSALDVINSYQRDRRARTAVHVMGHRVQMRRQYKADPRTRLVELLKRWMRSSVGNKTIDEDELRSLSGLCRDILSHQELFPARNERSFLRSVSEVYSHLQLQLREVLERDRTCAELAERVLSLSRNLLSDVVVYLLLAPTDLKQTDKLPSLEIVSLWETLPSASNPLPSRADPQLQKDMKDIWRTRVGSVIAAIVSAPWAVRLFEGKGAEEEASAANVAVRDGITAMLAEMRLEFDEGRYSNSGLTGVLRGTGADARMARECYLTALENVFDLVYLLGEAFVQFRRISDGLGDYGMIRVQPWLHPFLQALMEKVQKVQTNVNKLNEFLEKGLVIARAKGKNPAGPKPTNLMCERAHNAISRAITNRPSHAQGMLQCLEDLRARSAPERLPHLLGSLGDACVQLQMVMNSEEFRARVGDDFPVLAALPGPTEPVGPGLLSVCDATAPHSLRDGVEITPTAPCLGRSMTCEETRALPLPPAVSIEPTTDSNPFENDAVGFGPFDEDTDRSNPFARSNPFEDDAVVNAAAMPKVEPALDRVFRQVALPPSPSVVVPPEDAVHEKRWADVHRLVLTIGGHGWRRHDRRSLLLSGETLLIYGKGSQVDVKSEVNLRMIRTCSLTDDRGQRVLRLVFWRPVGRSEDKSVSCPKEYAFEFDMASEAAAFHDEIARARLAIKAEA
jgi:hypothetical protein